MLRIKIIALGLCIFSALHGANANPASQAVKLEQENQAAADYSIGIKKMYELKQNEKWRDVTQEVLASSLTTWESKESINEYKRRIIVFQYPSDGLSIKGFFTYTPHPDFHPLLIIYRWGNTDFALMNPGDDFATYKNYTVISSTLRGGVSQGQDEFGGADVDDMKNLMEFLPRLSQELGIELHPTCVFMMGPSRGGMEMFLTLARFPELQNHVSKIVSLSGILDMHRLIQERPDGMKKMFQDIYGLKPGKEGEAWIAKRDPMNTIPYLKKSLPILIVQGTADDRIGLAEGKHMVSSLKTTGHQVNYWEVKGGNHVLTNQPFIMTDIARWLESNSACTSHAIDSSKKADAKTGTDRHPMTHKF